jgi:hypothetical protein
MGSTNHVIVTGRVSRPPQRVRIGGEGSPWGYALTLAVRTENGLIFPTAVVEGSLPPFVTYDPQAKLHDQILITVIGRIRTRNLTLDLATEVTRLAQRAGAGQEMVDCLTAALKGSELVARRVVTDLLAEQVLEGGNW